MTVLKEEPLVKEEPSVEQAEMFTSLAKRYAGPYPGWGAPTEAACRVSGAAAKVTRDTPPPPFPPLERHTSLGI